MRQIGGVLANRLLDVWETLLSFSIYLLSNTFSQNIDNCSVAFSLLFSIFIRFGSKLYRQIVDIPMGTNCAPLFADLFYNERNNMLSLLNNNQNDIIEAFLKLHLQILR